MSTGYSRSDTGGRRPNVSIQDPAATNKDQDQNEDGRPDSLRRTSMGGSRRLSMLSDIVRSYSEIETQTQTKKEAKRSSTDSAMYEIFQLQRLLAEELPGISRISLPSRISGIFVPRLTFDQVLADLENKGTSSSGELTTKWRPSEQRRVNDFIREIALKKLEADTFNKLQITYNNHLAMMGAAPVEEQKLKFCVFGWTLEDFIARRQERNTLWLEMLLHRSEKDLQMMKFKCDVEEMSKLLKLIFQGLKATHHEAKSELFAFVHDAREFLKFPQLLKFDAKRNMERLHECVNTYLDMRFYKRGAQEEAYKLSLEQKLMDMAVLGPIELRHEVNWMRTKTDQAVMRITNSLEDLEKKAEDYRAEESKESYCARCALDMYYLDIEKFKTQINALTIKYDTEFDKAENEIAYKKISMDKIRAQRRFLEEEIVRFHDELEAMRQKEIDDQLAEEERKREEEQRALEEAEAKKKKQAAKDKKKKK